MNYKRTVLKITQKYSIHSGEISITDNIKSLGIDSIKLVELILLLQQELHITVDESKLFRIKTVSDIVDLVNKSKAGS